MKPSTFIWLTPGIAAGLSFCSEGAMPYVPPKSTASGSCAARAKQHCSQLTGGAAAQARLCGARCSCENLQQVCGDRMRAERREGRVAECGRDSAAASRCWRVARRPEESADEGHTEAQRVTHGHHEQRPAVAAWGRGCGACGCAV
eukprot:4997083-Prymnesium_polylepis.2